MKNTLKYTLMYVTFVRDIAKLIKLIIVLYLLHIHIYLYGAISIYKHVNTVKEVVEQNYALRILKNLIILL